VSKRRFRKGAAAASRGETAAHTASLPASYPIPLDICNEFRAKGLIGALDGEYYVTVGNLTPVARCEQFAIEMSARLQEKGVTGVILTSS
jgi:glycine/betaine/sarcosine/D-proline reductase family selenoprotein B